MVVLSRTILLYIFVVIATRLMGKRQIGELQPFELVIAVMLSELASVPMQDIGIPLINGIIPILALVCIELTVSFLMLKFRPFRKVVCGVPSILIKNGHVLYDQLKKQRFNMDDLMEELRLQGYLNIADIEYAILETGGRLSIIPKGQYATVTPKDLNLKTTDPKLPFGIIMDGVLNFESLSESGHDMKWLKDSLKSKGFSDISDVFIAIIDTKGNLFVQGR